MLSLKYICEKNIEEMEVHIQKYREKLLCDENDCLKIYKQQEQFKFLPGHRSILLDLSQSIKKMQAEKNLHGNDMRSVYESNNEMKIEYSFILNKLINTAKRNNNKSKNAYQYDDTIKYFSTYIFLLCGRTCYETLNKNLPIPSTKTIRKYKCSGTSKIFYLL